MTRARRRFESSGWLILGCVFALTSGCMGTQRRHTTTSVVDYLYPDAKNPIAAQGVSVLTLPMPVGIAFVPEPAGMGALTEAKKTALLELVAGNFRKPELAKLVKSIEIIPSAYLTQRGGFENLDQIRTMYGVESIALVSYDQSQFTDQGVASLSYWTIIGAYLVQGEKNSTATMVDAVVMHIPSRKLLFRAPGVSQVQGHATPINLSEELRTDSETGFHQAVDEMIKNLGQQLVAFQEKVKTSPEDFQVVHTSSSKGGGALDAASAALIGALLMGGAWWSRRAR